MEEKKLIEENEKLKSDLEQLNITLHELSTTNEHLVSATWRERNIKKQLSEAIEEVSRSKELIETQLNKELDLLRIMLNEVESTNHHLISATWRERDLKKKLSDAVEEISKSKQVIELQNKRIEESINYAERIQLSILPDEKNLHELFPESFLFFIPRDKVSGDFTWIHKRGDETFISVIDCTGHGIPGALMSLLGHFVLNETMYLQRILSPSHLLDGLHKGVKRTLKQETNKESRDGMDIAMCQFNHKTNILQYSGAHRNLILIRNNELIEFRGDKRPIGGTQYNDTIPFANYEIPLLKGDTIYFYSDGLPDQIGGPEMRKMMNKKVKEILLENNLKEMEDIKKSISAQYETWKNKLKQIDDVLLIGIRF